MEEFKGLRKDLIKIFILLVIIFGTYVFIYLMNKNNGFLNKIAENLIK